MTKPRQEANYVKYGRILANKANAKDGVIACFLAMAAVTALGVALIMFWGKTGGILVVMGLALIPHTVSKLKKYRKAKEEYEDFKKATRTPWDPPSVE